MTLEYSTSTVILLSIGAVVLTAAMTIIVRNYFINKDAKKPPAKMTKVTR